MQNKHDYPQIKHKHCHGSNLLGQNVRQLESEFVKAAATVGQASKKQVYEELWVRVGQVATELVSSMSKTRAISQRINRALRKQKGISESLTISTAELMNQLPEKYKTTSGRGDFLQVLFINKILSIWFVFWFMLDVSYGVDRWTFPWNSNGDRYCSTN